MNKSRILVVDSIPAFRAGIIQWLNGEPDLAGCGEADSVVSARTALAELKPDLALLDLTLIDGEGLDLLRQGGEKWPNVRTLVMTDLEEAVYAHRAFRAGEWLEYTRTFGAQAFKVRLRQWVEGLPLSVTGLERAVTNDTVRSLVPLGVFLNRPNDGLYRTVPLTDAVGRNEVVFRPDAVATVRLKQLTDVSEGESLAHNFLVFIPVENAGVLRPLIAEVHPWPGEKVSAADHEIRAVIVNRDTAVNVGTIELKLNGELVVVSVQPGDGMVTVLYPATGLGAGSTNLVEVQFADNVGVEQTESWSYTIADDGVPRLESAEEVDGSYAWESSAVVDLEARTIRVAAPAQPRFYRLSVTGGTGPGPVRIESIQVEDREVVLNYGW